MIFALKERLGLLAQRGREFWEKSRETRRSDSRNRRTIGLTILEVIVAALSRRWYIASGLALIEWTGLTGFAKMTARTDFLCFFALRNRKAMISSFDRMRQEPFAGRRRLTTFVPWAVRIAGICVIALATGWTLTTIFLLAFGEDLHDALIPNTGIRIGCKVEPGHPLIQALARNVRTATSNPLERAAVAEQVTWNLIRYWDTDDVWGHNCVPSIDEMIARARTMGWETPRGNCISQSIVLCSLLQALGFDSHIKVNPRHAYVEFQYRGKTLNLLFPADSLSLQEHLPVHYPTESALRAAQRLGASPAGMFTSLAELRATARARSYFSQPQFLLLGVPFLGFWLLVFQAWDVATTRRTVREKRDDALRTPERQPNWETSRALLRASCLLAPLRFSVRILMTGSSRAVSGGQMALEENNSARLSVARR